MTIRSAEIRDRTLRMFAGAGVVAGSDPEVELAETGAKLRTMLHAHGTTRRAVSDLLLQDDRLALP